MLQDIKTGNTITDGKEFRFWVVGRVEKWCKANNVPFDTEKYGLRNSSNIEVKWGIYDKGDSRSEWASCSSMIGMSILLRGDSTFYFRDVKDHVKCTEVRLKDEGDYVLWKEEVEHSWNIHENSVFLTLRWPAGNDQIMNT
jgi:hypothetical protein